MAEKFKFVKTRVDKLQFSGNGKKDIYWDTEFPGARFGLYVTQTGVKSYFSQGRYPDGKAAYTVIGRADVYSPEEAREIAREHHKLYAKGANPKDQVRAPERLSLATVLESYLSARKPKESTRDYYQDKFDSCLKDWAHLHPADITRQMVIQKHAELSVQRKERITTTKGARTIRRGGPVAADQALQMLGYLFDYAVEVYEDEVPRNPVKVLSRTKSYHGYSPRSRYLRPDQLSAWWPALMELKSRIARDYLLTLLFTGCRHVEGAALRVKDIRLQDHAVTFRETKNGRALTVPIPAFLFAILERRARMMEEPDEFIFPGTGKGGHYTTAQASVDLIMEGTGIYVTHHDLRRSYKTYAKNCGISKLIRDRLQNHGEASGDDMDAWYIQHEVEDLRPAVEQIAAYILEHAGVTPADPSI